MARTRSEKYDDFQQFLKESNRLFNELMTEDEDSIYFDKQYSLHIVPGGWNGGIDKRILEVFYGSRPYDSYDSRPAIEQAKTITDKPPKQMGFHVEGGARLVYARTAKGNVNCTLMPATADGEKQPEAAIQLDRSIDPRNLFQMKILRNHWKYFMSYMKVTSLDGDPSFLDTIRVSHMRLLKKRFKDGTDIPPLIYTGLGHVAKWTATVGLSGLLIYLFTKDNQPAPVHFDPNTTQLIENSLKTEQQLTNELSKANASLSELNIRIKASASVKMIGPNKHSEGATTNRSHQEKD